MLKIQILPYSFIYLFPITTSPALWSQSQLSAGEYLVIYLFSWLDSQRSFSLVLPLGLFRAAHRQKALSGARRDALT